MRYECSNCKCIVDECDLVIDDDLRFCPECSMPITKEDELDD